MAEKPNVGDVLNFITALKNMGYVLDRDNAHIDMIPEILPLVLE